MEPVVEAGGAESPRGFDCRPIFYGDLGELLKGDGLRGHQRDIILVDLDVGVGDGDEAILIEDPGLGSH